MFLIRKLIGAYNRMEERARISLEESGKRVMANIREIFAFLTSEYGFHVVREEYMNSFYLVTFERDWAQIEVYFEFYTADLLFGIVDKSGKRLELADILAVRAPSETTQYKWQSHESLSDYLCRMLTIYASLLKTYAADILSAQSRDEYVAIYHTLKPQGKEA